MRYGDETNLKRDFKIINEILDRQGVNILILAIAEHVGNVAIRHSLTWDEIKFCRDSILNDLKEEIGERT